MTGETYPVVILAGGPTPEKIMDAGETEPERAFIDVGGKPMLQWVLDAVRKSDICGDILCIGNAERLRSTFDLKPEEVKSQQNTLLENFVQGMEHFKDYPYVINATCDIPFLTAESLNFIAGEVGKVNAAIYYPIINVKEFDKKFPDGKRTTQNLKEGVFTGGNVFILDPKEILRNLPKIERIIRDRKSPAKMIRLFGLPFIVKFALKMLDLKGLEAKATQLLGAKMVGVITPYPEIGFDVDKPVDLTMARDIIGHA